MIYINDQIDLIDLEKMLATIPAQRREQALRYKHEQERRLLTRTTRKQYMICGKAW